MGPCFCHPPSIMDPQIEHFHAPFDNFRVQRLPYRENMPQDGQIVIFHYFIPRTHEHTKCCRRTVPDCDIKLLDSPVPRFRRESASDNDIRRPVQPWRKDTVGSTWYPARISRAPVYIILLQIQYIFTGNILLDHRLLDMQHTFWLAG